MRKEVMQVRVHEEDGSYTTYLPLSSVCAVLGRCATTLSRWTEVGAIRSYPTLIRGVKYVSLLDATLLRATEVKESQAHGVMRTPARILQETRRHLTALNEKTQAHAVRRREPWEESEDNRLIALYERGASGEEIAETLGRTYSSVTTRAGILRDEGLMPREVGDGDSWLGRVLNLLSRSECQVLEEVI